MNITCIIDSEILNKDDDIVVTQCGHVFHRNCINEWLLSSKTCPSCRSPSSLASLIKIFFENDDDKANELHNELIKSNEKMAKELTEFREKANKQEAELIDLKIKHREILEKVKNLERTKQIDDMMLVTLRNIKDDSTKEIIKLNCQISKLKLDLLAEKELRRIHQTTLHKLDPNNENYDIKNITVDESTSQSNNIEASLSTTILPWLHSSHDNEISEATNKDQNENSSSISSPQNLNDNKIFGYNRTSKKDKNYVIPSKIQKVNFNIDNRKIQSPSVFNGFNYKREWKKSSFSNDGTGFLFDFSNTSSSDKNRLIASTNHQSPQTSSTNDSSSRLASSSFKFSFSNPSSFSSLFRFGNPSSDSSSNEGSSSTNSNSQQNATTSFNVYRDSSNDFLNGPRSSDR